MMNGSIFSDAAPNLLESHFRYLHDGSGISLEVILERGYRSILGKAELEKLGFAKTQQRTPGILIPLWGVDGTQVGYQYRPDSPRFDARGRPIKYESPKGSNNRLDCPPRCQKMLADPKVPLWITEGSKKADALASKGACATSLAGVWGFMGRNDMGGISLLADWDYIALNSRTVYLTFDSDIVAKPPVKKALERLGEHLHRKAARISVIYLPQDGDKKVGIDDYLLKHSLEEARALASELEREEAKNKERSAPGFVLADGTVGEMVVSDDGERSFVIATAGSVRRVPRYETAKVTYIPTSDPLVGEVVHFATTAVPYDSQTFLFGEVKDFVHRYLELPNDFEEIAALYVLLTWVYEFAPSIPYLRVIGDWGSGKTRFLQVVGSICFRPIFASGATTPSPIFRILEKFRGTLVFDEADFKDSSAWVEIVKLLNNGYRPGMPVLRAEKENGKWYPRSFQVFGPKLIATRYSFKDEALESRCLTAEMMPLVRNDIPRVLPASFEAEVKELRSKLLTFRLANLLKLKGRSFGNDLLEPGLQPRLQEILIPLKAMVNGDDSMGETLCAFIHRLQDNLFSKRRESLTGRVLAALIELHEEDGELSAKSIAEKANEMDEEAEELSSRKVGWVTGKLGLVKTRIPRCGRRVICWDDYRMAQLAAMYGLTLKPPISQQGTSPTSPFSPTAMESGEVSAQALRTSPKTSPLLEARPTSGGEDGDNGEVFQKDMEEILDVIKPGVKDDEDPVENSLGMTVEQALHIWAKEGKPVIHLGPGENCFDSERLLDHRDINPRHLAAVRDWLKKKSSGPLG